jgi:hypothetical protein
MLKINPKKVGQLIIIALVLTAGYFFYAQVFGATTVGKTLTPAGSLQTGLVGHWTFDGKDMINNVADVSGQGNNGSLFGQTSTTTVIGKVGQALEFDGVDDYVNTGDVVNLNSVSSFSISGWFKQDDSNVLGRFLEKSDNTINNDISVASLSGDLYFEVGNNANSYGYWTGYGSTIPSGEWFYLTVVFDGSGLGNSERAKIYVNGINRTLTFASTIPTTTANLSGYNFYVGKGADSFYAGVSDDVRVYSRALSASEIKQLYNLGR